MYVRFVEAVTADNPWQAEGLFQAAYRAVKSNELPEDERANVRAALDWMRDHLPVPPIDDRVIRGMWTERAVCWFRADADEPIGQMWQIVGMLKQQGVKVRLLQTTAPGKIVYRDRYQIVAESPQRAKGGLVCVRI